MAQTRTLLEITGTEKDIEVIKLSLSVKQQERKR
jgi:hypothetical protein